MPEGWLSYSGAPDVTARLLTLASALAFTLLLCGGPAAAGGTRFSGVASYYDKNYSGRTASGQRYDPAKFTAAHRTLPFGTRLRVTRAGRSVVVVINDRGPFIKMRVLDLSFAAAKALDMVRRGLGRVKAEIE